VPLPQTADAPPEQLAHEPAEQYWPEAQQVVPQTAPAQ
jgi:hypothetical protein